MGVKVSFSGQKSGDAGGWLLDGSEILIYKKHQSSKTETVISLIHEIAHHLWFIHEKNRQPDLKFEDAIHRQNLFEDEIYETPAPKTLRKKIYDVEVAGTQYWETIYKETNLKFPKWKLYASMEFDTWMYEVYYETGEFPNRKEKIEKNKEINNKHKNVKYE